ncbi:inositol monophosphatase [bacterium]|nr:inositol monophosphatase [bacterium]
MITKEQIQFAEALSQEAALAVRAAGQGAEVLMNYWRRLSDEQIHHKGAGDLVTEADLHSEQTIASFLEAEMPEAAILCEEGTERTGKGPIWYLDPLDGTTNFVQRFPVFCVSLALASNASRVNPELVCGIVYNPISGELFLAAKGKGSYLGTKQLKCSPKRNFSDAVIATGFPRRYADELASYLKEFGAIYPDCRAIRRAGSAALDLCWTAQGIFDGFWEHRLSPWDIAAGILIVEEAGGVCSDFNGERRFLESGNIVGAAPPIHQELLRHIQLARD